MKVVFSVFKGRNNALDLENHARVINELERRRIPFKPAIGRYKGHSELSLMVEDSKSVNALGVAYEYLKRYDQEAILLVERNLAGNDEASLLFNDRSIERLGYWIETEEKPLHDYTKVNGRYYTVKG